ncbi:hypothetical protein B0H11DRAFT_1977575 [Mycena galericulata]|nr:hypothetical protein B0H11DRAFT_1977575 [Mycena galericulata]
MALQKALSRYFALAAFFIASADRVSASVNFDQCFAALQSGSFGTTGGTDNQGNPVTDIANATAVTYELCVRACGTGSGAFSWSAFNQQFSAWLLPWIALLSQFPFGSKYKWDNLISVILALGSPCLAAYSLVLTVLNTNWVARRFANCKYPNSRHAALILGSLQQVPLKVVTEGGLLASLVVLPENDAWWEELAEWLDYADIHTFTIASVTSVAWVAIAYVLTIVDAFSTISTDPNNNGQGLSGVGSIWLWMLPVTIGYLQISPRSDTERVTNALNRANNISYVAALNGGAVNADTVNETRALSFHLYRDSLYRDEEATAPIYNYARFLPFVQVVEEFVSAFKYAADKANKRLPVDDSAVWEAGNGTTINAANRRGSTVQVEAYCKPPDYVRRSYWGPNVFSRIIIASLAALALQWGTAGASILIVYFTPTVGLGCRSGAYLLYSSMATLIWALLVISSIVSHYATTCHESSVPHRAAAGVALFIRRLAKFLATLNAAWILAAFLLQFGNAYDTCYCNSDVLGLGKRAYMTMLLEQSDISAMKAAWVGGVVLAVLVSSLFLGFINLFIDSPRRRHDPYLVSI